MGSIRLCLMLLFTILNFLYIDAATTSGPLTSFRDKVYAVDVAFGTPRQVLKLSIDINSDYTANVYSFICWQCCQHRRYDWMKSSSGECRYEDSRLSFAFCNDSLQVAGRTLPNVRFEEALRYDVDQPIFNQPFDGYVGLPSLLLDKSSGDLWTFSPRRTCTSGITSDAGYLSLGDADDVRCEQVLEWLPMSQDGGLSAAYAIHLESAEVGALLVDSGPWVAVLSTTSNSITVPGNLFSQLNQVWQATGDEVNGYTVDCSKVDAQNSLSLMFGRYTFNIPFAQLVEQVGTNCTLTVLPRTDYAAPYTVSRQWIIGLPFARMYCQVYDFKHARVAFALPKTNSQEKRTCVYSEPPNFPRQCTEPKTSSAKTAGSTTKSSTRPTTTSHKQRTFATSTSAPVTSPVQSTATTASSTSSSHNRTKTSAAAEKTSTSKVQEFTTTSAGRPLATVHSLSMVLALVLLSVRPLCNY